MTNVLVGIDVGGTAVKASLAGLDGNLIATHQISTEAERGPVCVLQRIRDMIRFMIRDYPRVRVAGIGIGLPGLVDTVRGVVCFLPNLATHWRGIKVADHFAEWFQCPVKVLNDARMATLGELRYGWGKGHPNVTFAFFSIGTGIGGGVVVNGSLRFGPSGGAGELGHQTIVADGLECGCGNFGCVETVASGTALVAESIRLMKCGMAPALSRRCGGVAARVTPKMMADVANEDPAIMHAIGRAAGFLGIAVANVVAVLHPDLIVLGGGVSEMGAILVDKVASVARDRVRMFPTEGLRVERSLLGDQAGVFGAIALASDIAQHVAT